MAYYFFFASIAVVNIIFILSLPARRAAGPNWLIGIASIAYSLIYDTLLGSILRLYHYISLTDSSLYTLLAAIFIYPSLNILYTMFLPRSSRAVLPYTGFWVMFMLIFEYASIKTGTIVLTGWRIIPWSIVTYIASYTWIYFFYRYLSPKAYKSTTSRA